MSHFMNGLAVACFLVGVVFSLLWFAGHETWRLPAMGTVAMGLGLLAVGWALKR